MRLVDLMRYCGIHSYRQGARHVHFNGVEKELPQGANGSYGTSLIYGTAMNPANDILIAFKHNGKLLAPDHGFPVRMIIPGGIGGRMVKWLANIEVLATESDNFYHQHDNKVLPAGIDMDRANQEGKSFMHTATLFADVGLDVGICNRVTHEVCAVRQTGRSCLSLQHGINLTMTHYDMFRRICKLPCKGNQSHRAPVHLQLTAASH